MDNGRIRKRDRTNKIEYKIKQDKFNKKKLIESFDEVVATLHQDKNS